MNRHRDLYERLIVRGEDLWVGDVVIDGPDNVAGVVAGDEDCEVWIVTRLGDGEPWDVSRDEEYGVFRLRLPDEGELRVVSDAALIGPDGPVRVTVCEVFESGRWEPFASLGMARP